MLSASFQLLPQNSGVNSVVSPTAHHLAQSAPVSEAKWCTMGALFQPDHFFFFFFACFIFFYTQTHSLTHSLFGLCHHKHTHITASTFFFLFLSLSLWFYASVLPSGQQPSEKKKPMSKCCLHHPTFAAILMSGHFNFLFLGRFKMFNVKAGTGRGLSLASDGGILLEWKTINVCLVTIGKAVCICIGCSIHPIKVMSGQDG